MGRRETVEGGGDSRPADRSEAQPYLRTAKANAGSRSGRSGAIRRRS